MDLKKIRLNLLKKQCRVHNKPADKIEIIGSSIELECCCKEFQKELIDQLKVEIGKGVKGQVEDMFKGLS